MLESAAESCAGHSALVRELLRVRGIEFGPAGFAVTAEPVKRPAGVLVELVAGTSHEVCLAQLTLLGELPFADLIDPKTGKPSGLRVPLRKQRLAWDDASETTGQAVLCRYLDPLVDPR